MTTRESTGESVAGSVNWRTKLRYVLNGDFVRSSPFWGIPFVIMGIAVYGGIGYNIGVSLTDSVGIGAIDWSTLDLEMYRQALADPVVHRVARNTFVLLVAFTAICLVLGLLLAILLDRQFRFKEQVQMIYLLPMSLSFVVTAQLWVWMYNPNNGAINVVLEAIGIGPFKFLGNPSLSLAAVIFALIWQYSGYTMIVYLAGLRSIPGSQFEAARIDGASTFRIYLRVIVPQLKAASVSAAVVLMVFALKAFTFLYALTGRYTPPKGTDILATLMMRRAFSNTQWAYGAAIATILLVMALGVIAPYLHYQYKRGSL